MIDNSKGTPPCRYGVQFSGGASRFIYDECESYKITQNLNRFV